MSAKQILNDRDLQGPSAQSGTVIRKRVNSVNNIRLACGHATDQHQSMTVTHNYAPVGACRSIRGCWLVVLPT